MKAPSRSVQLPPPVGGWDTREALADMPTKNAVILDNMFPSTDKVTLRRGSSDHATGIGSPVESLLEYTASDGDGQLFAVGGGSVYEVTTSGAVGAAVVTGFTNSRFQQEQVTTAGGQFLFACNGQDTPKTYDGSSWANTTITGPTVANIVWCNLYQTRLWVGEINSLSAWYLATGAIGGSATELKLPAKLGGYIMAMGTWTRDAGDGADDVAVFFTSEGEVFIYQGSDPGASDWAFVGRFRIGKPVGRRCMVRAGADIVLVTQDGFVSAATILTVDRSQVDKAAISAQINKAVNDAVRSYGGLFGWQPFIYPKGTMLIFNIPISSTQAHQYVFNTITGAPCRFTGLNALCWGLLNNNAYFGTSDGSVCLSDSGYSDNGNDIEGDALQAFYEFPPKGSTKAFKRVEPIFESNGDPEAALDLNIDYQIRTPTGVSGSSPSSAARWGISKWGVGVWGTASQIFRGWRVIIGQGRSASLRVRITTTTVRPSWVATNFTYIPGGQL